MTPWCGLLSSRMVCLVVCCGRLWSGDMVPSPFYSEGASDADCCTFGYGIDVDAARVDMG